MDEDLPPHEDSEAIINKQQPNSWKLVIATEFDLPPAVPWKLTILDKVLLRKMGISPE